MTLAKSSSRDRRRLPPELVEDVSLYEPIGPSTSARSPRCIEIVEARELLDRHPVISAPSPAEPVRGPHERDPGRALRCWRETGDEEVKRPLLRSIAGIAAALRNTG